MDMELRHTPRLHFDSALSQNLSVEIDGDRAHYLLHVLRSKAGDVIRLFNAQDGEWAAKVSSLSKRSLSLSIEQQTRKPGVEPDLWLCAAPIKKAHFDYMIEKATELGVAVIQPVLTSRTQIREVNLDRCRAIAVESAEQSERLTIPLIRKPVTLSELMTGWPTPRKLIVCAEWGEATPVGKALPAATAPAAILTGPEGGFAADELEKLRGFSQTIFVRLGPRILRADTAAIAALAAWQTLSGDWR
jgi:16S rRNA (uracil1498-N3)-methyltransferase